MADEAQNDGNRVQMDELVKGVATDIGYYQYDVKEVLDALLEHIQRHVASGRQVMLHGFGSFHPSRRRARTYRLPASTEVVYRPGKPTVRFVPGAGFKRAVGERD